VLSCGVGVGVEVGKGSPFGMPKDCSDELSGIGVGVE
jgi:hypothetical protein